MNPLGQFHKNLITMKNPLNLILAFLSLFLVDTTLTAQHLGLENFNLIEEKPAKETQIGLSISPHGPLSIFYKQELKKNIFFRARLTGLHITLSLIHI